MSGRGRHAATRRRGWRWLAGVTGLAVAGAAILAMSPAHATPDPVIATFGITGVTTSNCKTLATGGADVWVTPGGELDLKTSIIGINALGLSIDTSGLLGLDGSLTIDNRNPIAIQTTKTAKVTDLPTGDHGYKFSVSGVDLGLLGVVPISLTSAQVKAGLSLTWSGKIHVTTDAANCGIAVSAPSVGASASASGLPGISLPVLPPVQATLPVTVPTLPDLGGLIPGGGGKTSGSGSGHSSAPSSGTNYTPPGLTIPEQVVPKGYGNGAGTVGAGGGFGNALPDLGGALVNGAPDSGAGAAPSSNSSPAAANVSSNAADLAANPTPSAQLPVLLAILAIIALSLVTATYARLYLLRRN
jgi:hypothetical protein